MPFIAKEQRPHYSQKPGTCSYYNNSLLFLNKRWNWKALVFSVDPSFTTIAHLLFEERLSVLCFCIQVRLFYLTIAGATSQSDDIFVCFFKVYLLLQRRISSNSVMIWLLSWKQVKLWFPFSVGSTVRGLAQLSEF